MYRKGIDIIEGPAGNSNGPTVRGVFYGLSQIGTITYVIIETAAARPLKLIPAYAARVVGTKDAPPSQL